VCSLSYSFVGAACRGLYKATALRHDRISSSLNAMAFSKANYFCFGFGYPLLECCDNRFELSKSLFSHCVLSFV
jgi:hypothetical protein